MPNRLARETSPYLLQHAKNPVDWNPWDAEALGKARSEGKPIFLSIGYSACHWCHVMEHESFENAEIAAYLNEHFISIKVDREERPDLDQIYMSAVQLLTGRGGWPMSVFLTPDLKPFYGGTYWPPEPSRGMPGFLQVLKAVEEAWRVRRTAALEQSEELTRHIQAMGQAERGDAAAAKEIHWPEIMNLTIQRLHQTFDPVYGGFGQAPKFPHAMDLQFLLRMHARSPHPALLQMVETTLQRMAEGGIYDHLAGGFARYSVDEKWLVPHFEKMLYDNGLLIGVYLDAFLATGKAAYARVAMECGDYLLETMRDPMGGFHSAEDADSEGEEGKFYVWSREEIVDALGEEAARPFCEIYGATAEGNFEGHNILNLACEPADYAKDAGIELAGLEKSLAESRSKLLAIRAERIRPGKDDKVLTSWNALAISSLARLGNICNEPRFLAAAREAGQFLLRTMRDGQWRLLHTYREGMARQRAFLDDYAYLANALVDLFEADGEQEWIEEAVLLADEMLKYFADEEAGGFFYTASDQETLIARQKDAQDQSIPSGNGMAATALLRLATLTGSETYLEAARKTLEYFGPFMRRHPLAVGQMLIAADWLVGPRQEVVLCLGKDERANETARRALAKTYLPRGAMWVRNYQAPGGPQAAGVFEGLQGLAEGKVFQEEPVLYVCEGFACRAPIVGAEAIEQKLKENSSK